MSPEDVKKRLVEEIKARGYDDRYIDRNEEREIIQIAIQLGVTVESALAALEQVCSESGYVQESRVLRRIEEQIAAAASDGAVDRQEFDSVFASVKQAVGGKRTDREIKALIVGVMERTGHNKVRRGWFRNWYAGLKRELGMS